MVGPSVEPPLASRVFEVKVTTLARYGYFALALLMCLGSCTLEQSVADHRRALAFERIAQGDWFTGAGARSDGVMAYRLLRDETEWSLFWRRRFVGDVPRVSFRNHLVVAVFQGVQKTGGYGVDVVQTFLVPGEDALHVVLRIQEPGPHKAVDLGEISPYVIVKIDLPESAASALDRSRLRVGLYRLAESGLAPVEAVSED